MTTLVEEAVELKPCPFCGERLVFNGRDRVWRHRYEDTCVADRIAVPVDEEGLWNTRASLPTDDDDTVERAYRKGWNTGYNANTAGWKNVDEVIDESWIIDREAIHTLIGSA